MTSKDRVLVHFQKDGKWKWHIIEFSEYRDDVTLDAFGTLCSISPDGKQIVCVDQDQFIFFDIAKRSVTGSQRYSSNWRIFFLKWITEDLVYAAASGGILKVCRSRVECIIQYESSIKPECVSDIQIDEKSGYYIIQSNENGTGFIQYGLLTGQNGEVVRGRAGCLFYAQNCFYHDLMICYMRQDESNPSSFFMNTRCLTNPKVFGMKEMKMDFNRNGGNEYPLWLVPDPKGCLGYLFTQTKVFVFDLMTGIHIYTVGFGAHPVIAYARNTEGEVVVINEKEPNVATVFIPDKDYFLHVYADLGDNMKCSAFHMACRLELHDTSDLDIQNLSDALFQNTVFGALPTVKSLIAKMNLPDPVKALSEIGNEVKLKLLSRTIFDIWEKKTQIDWLFEVENWIRNHCGWSFIEQTPRIAGVKSDPIGAIANRFLEERIDIDSEIGKEITRDMYPDPFNRAINTGRIRKKIMDIRKKEYQDLAEQMKENHVAVGDEYYISILEEVYDNEEQRRTADAELRKFL